MQEQESVDRRRHPRHPCSGSAVIFHNGTRYGWGAVTEIGHGGCYVETSNTLPSGTSVHVRLTIAGLVMETAAAIAWCTPQVGMGIRFEPASAELATKVAQFVHRINGEKAPAEPAPFVPMHPQRIAEQAKKRADSPITPEAAFRILSRIVQRARQTGALTEQEIVEIVNANR